MDHKLTKEERSARQRAYDKRHFDKKVESELDNLNNDQAFASLDVNERLARATEQVRQDFCTSRRVNKAKVVAARTQDQNKEVARQMKAKRADKEARMTPEELNKYRERNNKSSKKWRDKKKINGEASKSREAASQDNKHARTNSDIATMVQAKRSHESDSAGPSKHTDNDQVRIYASKTPVASTSTSRHQPDSHAITIPSTSTSVAQASSPTSTRESVQTTNTNSRASSEVQVSRPVSRHNRSDAHPTYNGPAFHQPVYIEHLYARSATNTSVVSPQHSRVGSAAPSRPPTQQKPTFPFDSYAPQAARNITPYRPGAHDAYFGASAPTSPI